MEEEELRGSAGEVGTTPQYSTPLTPGEDEFLNGDLNPADNVNELPAGGCVGPDPYADEDSLIELFTAPPPPREIRRNRSRISMKWYCAIGGCGL